MSDLRNWSVLTEDEKNAAVEKAKVFIAGKASEDIVWDRVATHCGISHQNGLRLRLDEAYRDRRNRESIKYRQRHPSILQAGGFSATKMNSGDTYRPPVDDIMARLAEIPEDTRTLTGRLFGDPLPGRRALDVKRQAKSIFRL